MPADASDLEMKSSQRRKLPRWCVAAFLMMGLGTAVFHASLLESAFNILVVDEPAASCRYGLLLTPGPECYDTALSLLAQGAFEQVLVVDRMPRRSVVLGAMPEFDERVETELLARGLGPQQYRVINTQAKTAHQMFQAADEVLRDEAAASCLVISTATQTRYVRTVIDQALPAQHAARYRVRPVETSEAHRNDWWKSRSGVRQVMVNGLRLIFVCCVGPSEVDAADPYEHVMSRALRPG
jgi:hypothetical protein